MRKDPFSTEAFTDQAFASFGARDIAYIKPVKVDGKQVFGIFSAEGEQIMTAPSRETARELVRRSDLEPVLVH